VLPGFRFVWPAVVTDWHDGDTCYATVDRGRGETWPCHIRLLRLYCPELDPPQPGGAEALGHALVLAPPGTLATVTVRALGRAGRWSESTQMSLGRLLADVALPGGRDYADAMVADGFGSHTHVPGSGDGIRGLD
jgi:endonuclease YncB( thermonuclease family)